MDDIAEARIRMVLPMLNEKQARRYLGVEAKSLGFGGITEISKLTGMSRTTIRKGKREIENPIAFEEDRIRRHGGGRKPIEISQKGVAHEVHALADCNTYGDPESTVKWTTNSTQKMAEVLNQKGYKIGAKSVAKILKNAGYSLQSNKKCLQVGKENPDRDEQFKFINAKCKEFIKDNQPVISVDAKKKELIGNFKNNGKEYKTKGGARKVLDHDFPIKELGKVCPYGIYELNKNVGFINLGTNHDTSEFAVESIFRWWECMGKHTYKNATKIYINCDGGGSNGSRVRLWKQQLQKFANHTGLEVHVSHFPAGTSKWNKIEHKMFCFISKTWRGKPLISIETVISLISNTTTKTGLTIKCMQDNNVYETKKKISDAEMEEIKIEKNEFHGEWNYVISKQQDG
ncbi:transposase [Clostridia bacterium]|nr:transposase [Clostridia bacterium]